MAENCVFGLHNLCFWRTPLHLLTLLFRGWELEAEELL